MFAAKQMEDLGETMGWLEKMDPRLVPSKEKRLWTDQFKERKINDIAAICGEVTAQKKEIRRCWDAVKAHIGNATAQPPEAQPTAASPAPAEDFGSSDRGGGHKGRGKGGKNVFPAFPSRKHFSEQINHFR